MRRLVLIASILCLLVQVVPARAAEEWTRNGYYELGVFAYESEEYAQAEEYLLEALQRAPGDAMINHYLGKVSLELKKLTKAAEYLDRARRAQPDKAGLAYDLGMLNQLQGDYGKALSWYKKSLVEAPDDVMALYHAGVCAFSINRFREAVGFFQQAETISPSLANSAAFYSGISYFRMNLLPQADEQFRRAEALSDSEEMRENAAAWLAVVAREMAARKPYSLYLKVGGQYDDNVRLTTGKLDEWLDITRDKGDYLFKAYLSGRYYLLNQEAWRGGLGYSHYQTRYSKLNEYDLIGGIGDFFIDYYRFPFVMGISYQPSYYWLHTDSYLLRHQFGPHITWQFTRDAFATIQYNHKSNHYLSSRDRDGYVNEVRLYVDLRLTEEGTALRWSVGAEENQARRSYYDYQSLGTRLGFFWPLSGKTRIYVSGGYDSKKYDAADPVFSFKRSDKRYSGDISVERRIFDDRLGLVLDYDYSKNDSNNRYYDYTRQRVALSLNYRL